MSTIYFNTPSQDLKDAFISDRGRVARWVDIYEADNETLWRGHVGTIGGSVGVDAGRDERRNLDLTIWDEEGEISYGPDDGLWYDKIIKVYRGIEVGDDTYATCLGEFLVDTISRPHHPSTFQLNCRDFTKKLMADDFPETTTFVQGLNVGDVIHAIASNAGIVKFAFPFIDQELDEDFTFDRGSSRWAAIKALAEMINHEIFFSNFGVFTLRPFVDPLTAPVSYTFTDSGPGSNLASFTQVTADTEIRNDVIVYTDNDSFPLVYGHAENNSPSSPTRISRIGRRTLPRVSALLTTHVQAQALAESTLAVSALESYNLSLNAVVLPWLEVGEAVESLLSNRTLTDPTRYLLTSFSIPLSLGTMSASTKRITIVG